MPSDSVLYFAIVNLDQGRFGAVKAKSRPELRKLLKQGFKPIDVETCGEVDTNGCIIRTNPQKFDELVLRNMLGIKKQRSSDPVKKGISKIIQYILFGNGSAVKRLKVKKNLYASLVSKKYSNREKMR